MPSAKKIFGGKHDVFHAVNSDEQKREKLKVDVLSSYVKKRNLPITMSQNYGWPVKKLEESV